MVGGSSADRDKENGKKRKKAGRERVEMEDGRQKQMNGKERRKKGY